MSERTALLDAIRANPAEDTPRLMYADWLMQYGEGERDRATAEFIQVSCRMESGKDRQGIAEGRWLSANWQKLVPTLMRSGFRDYQRHGRRVKTWKTVKDSRGHEYPFWCVLTFWRGFVESALTYRPMELPTLVAVATDQPLAMLTMDRGVAVGETYSRIRRDAFCFSPGGFAMFAHVCGVPTHIAVGEDKIFPRLPGETGSEHATRAGRAFSDAIHHYVSTRKLDATPLTG